MPEPRKRDPERKAPTTGSWRAATRPDLSGPGLGRLAVRMALAGLTVSILAVFANWSASGFLDRGGLDRLLQMKNSPRQPEDATAPRGRLDKGRLKSVLAATERPDRP